MAKMNDKASIDPDFDIESLGSASDRLRGQNIKRFSNRKTGFTLSTVKMIFGSSIIFVAVLLVSLVALTFFANNSAKKAEQSAAAAENPGFRVRYDSIGKETLHAYFKGDTSPIPLSRNVQWKGTTKTVDLNETDPTKLQQTNTKSESTPTITGLELINGYRTPFTITKDVKLSNPEDFIDAEVENLTYYVVINGQPMLASISLLSPVSPDSKALPVLLESPTLSPPQPTGDAEQVSTDPGNNAELRKFDTNNKNLNSVVNRWAKAWVTNNQGDLLQITQDSKGRKYVGLGGWQLSSAPEIKWAYKVGSSDDVVMQISFDITQLALSKDSEGKELKKEFTSTQVMDLLVQKSNTDLPAIVSWGPAGTWEKLTPYSVAHESVSGEKEGQKELTTESKTTEAETTTSTTESSTKSTSSSTKGTDDMSPEECKEAGFENC